MLPGRLSFRRRMIQQSDGLLVSLVLHQYFRFADEEKRTPDPGLHPAENIRGALHPRQTGIQCACSGRGPAKKRFREAFPIENMMAIHDLNELFSERENGGRILLNHCFHRAMIDCIAACEVVPAVTSLTQTAHA